MKKVLIALLLLISLIISSVPVTAATQSQVSNQYSQVEDLKRDIQNLDSQINQLENQINNLNTEISKTSEELLQAQREEAELKAASQRRLRAAYMYGTGGYIEYLFSADSPADFISYYDVAKEILSADKDSAKQLKEKREQIQALQEKLTNDRNSLIATKTQAESSRAQKQSTLLSNENILHQLESELGNETITTTTTAQSPIVSVTEAMQQSVLAEKSTPLVFEQDNILSPATMMASESGEGAEENNASSATTLPRFITQKAGYETQANTDNGQFNTFMVQLPTNNGESVTVASGELSSVWYWPIDGNDPNAFVITSFMGTRESPGGIGSTNHAGTDIGASYGAAIIAAQSGRVNIAGSYGGYGNAVQIDHGNGYETLYGHMSSIAVTNGQTVTAGQIIGFVGSTGWSTGPHLHFEVHYRDGNGYTSIINGLSLYGSNVLARLSY